MRPIRRLLAVAALLVLAVTPAHAAQHQIHFLSKRGTSVLDSTVVTFTPNKVDTTGADSTTLEYTATTATLDTANTLQVPHNDLCVVLEVTGTMTSTDSFFVAVDGA